MNDACHACGGSNEHLFTVTKDNQTYTFDCFECAIHTLAPDCAECGVTIIGHGVSEGGAIYCCNHCAGV